jgi:hypothetical protein
LRRSASNIPGEIFVKEITMGTPELIPEVIPADSFHPSGKYLDCPNCGHPALCSQRAPRRGFVKEYNVICPDCGHLIVSVNRFHALKVAFSVAGTILMLAWIILVSLGLEPALWELLTASAILFFWVFIEPMVARRGKLFPWLITIGIVCLGIAFSSLDPTSNLPPR